MAEVHLTQGSMREGHLDVEMYRKTGDYRMAKQYTYTFAYICECTLIRHFMNA